MAALSDCGSCMSGDHTRHDGRHRGLRGVLGGSICVCQGDCVERHAAAMERYFAPIRAALAEMDRDGSQETAPSEAVSDAH